MKSYEFAGPRCRALCMKCGARVVGWRFDLRVKRSRRIGDQLRIHADCIDADIPGLEASRHTIAKWRFMPDIGQAAKDMLDSVSARLVT